MASILISAFKIIFLLGFLIGIHEGGHFLVAKLCKVRVNEFAIGFGPTIWKKQGKETKYAIRLIPLGGFVSMEGEEERSDKEGSFTQSSIPKRIAIVIAGAMVNIIFALIIYFILATSVSNNLTTIIDSTVQGYAAASVGLESGDEILKINDKRVLTENDIASIMDNQNGNDAKITYKRNNQINDIYLKPTEVKYKNTGLYLYQPDENSTKVAGVIKDGPAEKSGIEAGDYIISVNGINVKDNTKGLIEILSNNNNDRFNFEIERKGKNQKITVNPTDESAYYLGVKFKQADNNLFSNMYYGILNTKDFIVSIGENIKQLFTGKVSTDQLMGPVGISEAISKTNGFKDFIYMMALISMSLGVTNLLPFPPLDGGKIVFLIIEGIRKKPIKQEIEAQIQFWGFAVLILLSVYVTYHDILRIF